MDYITLIGLVAGAITTISLLPQILKAWRTKSTRDISFTTYSLFCVGILLWFIYGVLLQDLPIIGSNFVSLILGLIILMLKAKYK